MRETKASGDAVNIRSRDLGKFYNPMSKKSAVTKLGQQKYSETY